MSSSGSIAYGEETCSNRIKYYNHQYRRKIQDFAYSNIIKVATAVYSIFRLILNKLIKADIDFSVKLKVEEVGNKMKFSIPRILVTKNRSSLVLCFEKIVLSFYPRFWVKPKYQLQNIILPGICWQV